MDMFLDGGDLDFEDQDILEDQYISDFNIEDNKKHELNNQMLVMPAKPIVVPAKKEKNNPKKQQQQQ